MRRALASERVICKKRAREHHDRVEHLQNVAQKGGQLADAHVAPEDEPAAEPLMQTMAVYMMVWNAGRLSTA